MLASHSPRRAALLRQTGFDFEIIASTVDEAGCRETDPVRHVLALSALKAQAVRANVKEALVIGADTIVSTSGMILGKPGSREESCAMLERLSGRSHEVYTGLTLIGECGDQVSGHEMTKVHFRKLDPWEIRDYVNSREPLDKAGAYGIQGRAALFVDRIEGCYFNVVGFPLSRFFQLLETLWPPGKIRMAMGLGEGTDE
ncbi:septum formation protein Maf [bacterium]|nr:septum formation protein Maf [bacterium]